METKSTPTLEVIAQAVENFIKKTKGTTSLSVIPYCEDLQTLSVKAFHTMKVRLVCVALQKDENGKSLKPFTTTIAEQGKVYNHAATSYEEAKNKPFLYNTSR